MTKGQPYDIINTEKGNRKIGLQPPVPKPFSINKRKEVNNMKYRIVFMKKNGKIKGQLGCNSEETAKYIVKNWREAEDTKGICIVTNLETGKEHVWTK